MLAYFSTDNLNAGEVAGKVVGAKGQVLIRSESDALANTRTLKNSDEVRAGDVINTSNDGTVRLLMSDQTIVDLMGSSLFKVNDYRLNHGSDRRVDLSLGYGKVRTSVTKPVGNGGKFIMHTKTATMGVRGTEFIVQSDIGEKLNGSQVKTEIIVSHGKVEVVTPADKRPVTLTDGKLLTTTSEVTHDSVVPRSTAPPIIKELPKAEIAQAIQQSRVETPIFHDVVTIDKNSKTGASSGLANLALPPMNTLKVDVPMPQYASLPGGFGVRITPNSITSLPPGTPVNVKLTFSP